MPYLTSLSLADTCLLLGSLARPLSFCGQSAVIFGAWPGLLLLFLPLARPCCCVLRHWLMNIALLHGLILHIRNKGDCLGTDQ